MGFSPDGLKQLKNFAWKKYHQETDTKLTEHEKEKLIRTCVCVLDIIKI